MRFKEKEILEFKKPHACGNNKWEVEKTGATINLICTNCLRKISLLPSDIDKRIKHKKQ